MLGSRRDGQAKRGDAEPEDRTEGPDARKRTLYLAIAALPLLIVFYVTLLIWSTPRTGGEELRLDQFYALVEQGRVRDATILEVDRRVVGTYDGGTYWATHEGDRSNSWARLISTLDEFGVPYAIDQQSMKALLQPLTLLLPALILVDGFIVIFLLVGPGSANLFSMRRSGARRFTGGSRIAFSDVAGLDEAVEELAEIKEYLDNPDRFMSMGAAVPKGILLVGPPGCGKTLLARAVAGESDVPFYSIAGSDFVEVYVGVGAARIRDLFEQAKVNAPAIVFIDELDAVGRGRSAGALSGQDEREATLNQLLVELDGFDSGTGVVVLAATNRHDVLDPALLRPGRFDRRVQIDRPDVRGRVGVLKIHARGKPLADDVELEQIARRTAGFSGADLASVVNEAALLAARREATEITSAHLLEAIERVLTGPERRSRILSPEDRRRLAVHEAGHAVAAASLPSADPVAKVSIVSRGHVAGFTWHVPEGDQRLLTRSQMLDRMAGLLAGRAAEELVLGESSSASQNDLERAMQIARTMVSSFGMGTRLGPVTIRSLLLGAQVDGLPAPSERLVSEIDDEVRELLDEAGKLATSILSEHRASLERLADRLVEIESLEGDALRELLGPVSVQEERLHR